MSATANGIVDRTSNQIIHSDCREVLRSLPDNCASLTHTSPPYNIGRKYTGFRDQQDIDQYLDLVKDVLEQLFRVTCPGGSVFWQVGYTNFGKGTNGSSGGIVPLDALTIPIATSLGFLVWDRIIWNYYGSMAFRSKFTNRHETIIWFTKPASHGGEPFFDLDAVREKSKSYDGRNHLLGRNPGNVWYAERVAFGSIGQTSHVAVFPEEVSEKIVRSCSAPGKLVLDPFSGSGTLAKVAHSLGRRFVGAEISEQYLHESYKRIGLWASSEAGNLAVGLLVKYGFHTRAESIGKQRLSQVLESHLLGRAKLAEIRSLRERVQAVLDAPRVTKAVKEEKQEMWMQYDDAIDAGDEADEIVAADRALAFCFAHRHQWNGLRRYLTAASALIELQELIDLAGSAERFVTELCRLAPSRFEASGRTVRCMSSEAGLGTNGLAARHRTNKQDVEDQLAFWK